jgi:hypothetical protein
MATGSYEGQWQQLCAENWTRWADQHGYDVRMFNQPLDHSPKAQGRAPAWQKLLVMASPELKAYDSCLWVDADILIHPQAPDPYLNLDADTWAVTIESGSRFSADSAFIKQHTEQALSEVAQRQGLPWRGYFETWGFDSHRRPLFNAGVVGYSPSKHHALLLHPYHDWVDGGPGSLAEMLPFNLAVQASGWQALDGRYNRLILAYSSAWNDNPERTCRELGFQARVTDADQFVEALFQSSYFLHFAGMHNLMARIGPSLISRCR